MDTRQVQISELLKNVTGIKEKYNNVYEVLWYEPKVNRTVCFSVTLPPQFPTVPPVFRIAPSISHPWVDSNGVVIGHKKTGANWNQHVSLANVTNEIITELKASKPSAAAYSGYNSLGRIGSTSPSFSSYYNRPPPPIPPQPLGMPYPNYQGMNIGPGAIPNPIPNPSYLNPSTNTNSSSLNNYATTASNISSNPSNIDLQELESLSIDELKELLNNEEKRREFINGRGKVKEMYSVKEEMSTGNKNLAEKNLAYKEKFEKLKTDLKEQQELLKAEKARFEALMNEQQQYVSNFTPIKLHSTLEQATARADEESEEIANEFLMGVLSADEFLKKYRKSRKLYHLRAEKLELFRANEKNLFTNQ